jgi:hypothetical protein
MSVEIEITSAPGLIDPGTGQPVTGEPYESALNDFLSSRGVANTDVEVAVREALLRAEESANEATGWWDAVRYFFAPETHNVVDTEEARIELAGYWLTLPDVPEAKVTLTVSVTDKSQRAMSVKIAGIGGGPSFELTVKSGLQHEATSQQRAVLATRGAFQRVQVTRGGKPIGEYARLVALDEDNVEWSYPAAALPGSAQLGQKGPSVGYDLRANTSADKVTLDITQGTTWDFSAGLKLTQLGGIEAGISGQVSYQRDASYEYELPPGRRYQATKYASFPVYVWIAG